MKALRHQTLQLPGLRMHCVEVGEGQPVLLLHGFPESWHSWRNQLQPLAEAGFRVIAPDLRGYGETEKQGPYDLETICTDLTALLGALGVTRAHVIGHDWGGATAWQFAATKPAFVDRLAVLNCPHPALFQRALVARPDWKQWRSSWYMLFFQLPWLPEYLLTRNDAVMIEKLIRASCVNHRQYTKEELRPFRDAAQQPGAMSAMLGWYRAAFRTARAPTTVAPIAAKTLLVWAMNDPALLFDSLVPGTEQFAPDFRLAKIEGCGHFLQSEKPAEVTAVLLDYLKAP